MPRKNTQSPTKCLLDYKLKYVVNTVNVTADLEKDLFVQDSSSVWYLLPRTRGIKGRKLDHDRPRSLR